MSYNSNVPPAAEAMFPPKHAPRIPPKPVLNVPQENAVPPVVETAIEPPQDVADDSSAAEKGNGNGTHENGVDQQPLVDCLCRIKWGGLTLV